MSILWIHTSKSLAENKKNGNNIGASLMGKTDRSTGKSHWLKKLTTSSKAATLSHITMRIRITWWMNVTRLQIVRCLRCGFYIKNRLSLRAKISTGLKTTYQIGPKNRDHFIIILTFIQPRCARCLKNECGVLYNIQLYWPKNRTLFNFVSFFYIEKYQKQSLLKVFFTIHHFGKVLGWNWIASLTIDCENFCVNFQVFEAFFQHWIEFDLTKCKLRFRNTHKILAFILWWAVGQRNYRTSQRSCSEKKWRQIGNVGWELKYFSSTCTAKLLQIYGSPHC